MKIWFIRCETEYGPFFSSLENVRGYLQDPDHRPTDKPDNIEEILNGTNPYMSVQEVELDDISACFDG